MNMNWFEDFQEECKKVFAEVEARISTFPSPLDRIGRDYLDQFNPLHKESAKNYICYLLPYWVHTNTSSTSLEFPRKLALANTWIMLYFFILDDIMDEEPQLSRPLLPLLPLCTKEWESIYRAYYDRESPFWDYYDELMTIWARRVTNEHETNPFIHDPLSVGDKAAPAKLAAVGTLIANGQINQMNTCLAQIDLALLALQMSDDWKDWQEDLHSGSYNGLVSLVRHHNKLQEEELVTEQQVREAIYDQNILTKYLSVMDNNTNNSALYNYPFPYLSGFIESVLDDMKQEAHRIQTEINKLINGGLFYWVTSNENK